MKFKLYTKYCDTKMRFTSLLALVTLINAISCQIIVQKHSASLKLTENARNNDEFYVSTIFDKSQTRLQIDYKLYNYPNSASNEFNCSKVPIEDSNPSTDFKLITKTSTLFNNSKEIWSDKIYISPTSQKFSAKGYKLCLEVNAKNTKPQYVSIELEILAKSENKPIFDRDEYTVDIMEGLAPPAKLNLNIKAHYQSSGSSNERIKYTLQSDEFEINSSTGEIFTKKVLMSANKSRYKLKVFASNSYLTEIASNSAIVTVNVLPSNKQVSKTHIKFLFADSLLAYDFSEMLQNNDSFPAKQNPIGETSLYEDTLDGSLICYIIVFEGEHDSKSAVNLTGEGEANFHLEKSDFGSDLSFLIDSSENSAAPSLRIYSLTLAQKLDRELKDLYSLRVEVSNDEKLIISSAQLYIKVLDVNDNAPKFDSSKYQFEVYENRSEARYCLGNLKATDTDFGVNQTIEYFFLDNLSYCNEDRLVDSNQGLRIPFEMDKVSGEICTKEKLDREICWKYILKAVAKDLGKPAALQSDEVEVVIDVKDVNDNAPQFYQIDARNKSADEAKIQFYLSYNSPVGTFVGWAQAFDLDSENNSMIDYKLANARNPTIDEKLFDIDSFGIIRTRDRVDKLKGSSREYTLRVIASDRGVPLNTNQIDVIVKFYDESDDRVSVKLAPIDDKYVFVNSNSWNKVEYMTKVVISDARVKSADYQLTPSLNLFYQSISSLNEFDYGLNCRKNDISKNFRISENGEIFLVKDLSFSSKPVICFVSIGVVINEQSASYLKSVDVVLLVGNEDNDKESLVKIADEIREKYVAGKTEARSNETSHVLANLFLGLDLQQTIIIVSLSFSAVALLIITTSCILIRVRRKKNMRKVEKNDNKGDDCDQFGPKLFVNTLTPSESSCETNSNASSCHSKLSDTEPITKNCALMWTANEFMGAQSMQNKIRQQANNNVNNICEKYPAEFDSNGTSEDANCNNRITSAKFNTANPVKSCLKTLNIDKSTIYSCPDTSKHGLKYDSNLIATVHWSPASVSNIKKLSQSSASPISSSNDNCYQIALHAHVDEGCYGSSDMSGDSIDAPSSSGLLAMPNLNPLNSRKKSYVGIYHLNSNQTCVIEDDCDSAIHLFKDDLHRAQEVSLNNLGQLRDASKMKQFNEMRLAKNLPLERFEKIYYQSERDVTNQQQQEQQQQYGFRVCGSFV